MYQGNHLSSLGGGGGGGGGVWLGQDGEEKKSYW